MKKLTIIAMLFVVLFAPVNFLASDDNIGFDFTIKPNQGNTRTDPRYRATTNYQNPWKVKMTDSWECDEHNDGCITTFWLEVGDGTNVSKSVDKAENQDASYTEAYTSANKKDVRLTAENNNYNAESYRVKGVWDEETW